MYTSQSGTVNISTSTDRSWNIFETHYDLPISACLSSPPAHAQALQAFDPGLGGWFSFNTMPGITQGADGTCMGADDGSARGSFYFFSSNAYDNWEMLSLPSQPPPQDPPGGVDICQDDPTACGCDLLFRPCCDGYSGGGGGFCDSTFSRRRKSLSVNQNPTLVKSYR